ncbi:AzlC family ABC transporter permease [Tumebacillus permanentifrigoris]|uniref:4-azaleucine resistance transporter AzlC n=1 Tax=Tumebacillus permanentifrigoris TaxID=378543 RepID=A0A316D8L8_9BACL|nr:AzlC family ABC transporter permease [Tumebacillus permanentifrigoris]PWK10278.1 4-azaleucine resistance transporter AzlC [Tumebacillus permanentifrigoris]
MAESVANTESRQNSSPVIRGMLQALPVVMGYIPVGFAYGVLAGQAHLSLFSTLLMSLIVYAGSSQLIAAGLFASGQPMLSILLTTFIVNLRHLLMSAAISPHLSRWPTLQRLLFALELTDETFALHSLQFAQRVPGARQVFAVNITSHLSWIFGSWLGFVANTLLTDVRPFGLDYALPAMFVALLLLQIQHVKMVVIAVLSGALAVLFNLLGFETWSVMLATVLGATLGVVLETWTNKQS